MALQAQQIVTLAAQDARKPGFLSQAGALLNTILQNLCLNTDLEINKAPTTVLINQSPLGPDSWVGVQPGCGPFHLPNNYLRMVDKNLLYNFQGTPFKMIQEDLSKLDFLSLLPLTSTFPQRYATDRSTTPPSLFVWPPSALPLTLNFRYYQSQPDIAGPQSSTVIPWFPDQLYLQTKLTALLLKPDPAWREWDEDAEKQLNKYLKMESDSEGRAIRIELDERFFGDQAAFWDLPGTKTMPF